MPMGDHLTHPDVPSPRSLNLSALRLRSARSPPPKRKSVLSV